MKFRVGFGPSRKRTVAVRNFSAEFEKNTNTVIMGERYGGKSTLVNIMAGTVYPTLGRVVVNGNVGFCAQVGKDKYTIRFRTNKYIIAIYSSFS